MFDDEVSHRVATVLFAKLSRQDTNAICLAGSNATEKRHAIGFRVALAGQAIRRARFEPSFLLLLLLHLLGGRCFRGEAASIQ
jgi:hypothetical protein